MNFLMSYLLLRDPHCVYLAVPLGTAAVTGAVLQWKFAVASYFRVRFSVALQLALFHTGVSKGAAAVSKHAVQRLKIPVFLDTRMISFLEILTDSLRILCLMACKECVLFT